MSGVGSAMRKGYFQRNYKQKKDRDGKVKEKDLAYVTGSNESDALIFSLSGSSESWVIDLCTSFHATTIHEIFQT